VTARSLSLDRLRTGGESFMREISREYYLAHSGQKPQAELQPLYAKYAEYMNQDALAFAVEAFRAAGDGSEEQRSARLILDWQAEAQSSRELAALDEREIAWEGTAVVRVADGREIQFEALPIELANNPDAADRHLIDQARSALVKRELAPIRRERFQREREITERLGLGNDYNATWEMLSGVSLASLRAECEQFLRDTQALWDTVLPEFSKRVLSMAPSELTRADALAMFRAREFDAYFPANRMEESICRQVRDMGVDPLGRPHHP
jgi:hypothetical protein